MDDNECYYLNEKDKGDDDERNNRKHCTWISKLCDHWPTIRWQQQQKQQCDSENHKSGNRRNNELKRENAALARSLAPKATGADKLYLKIACVQLAEKDRACVCARTRSRERQKKKNYSKYDNNFTHSHSRNRKEKVGEHLSVKHWVFGAVIEWEYIVTATLFSMVVSFPSASFSRVFIGIYFIVCSLVVCLQVCACVYLFSSLFDSSAQFQRVQKRKRGSIQHSSLPPANANRKLLCSFDDNFFVFFFFSAGESVRKKAKELCLIAWSNWNEYRRFDHVCVGGRGGYVWWSRCQFNFRNNCMHHSFSGRRMVSIQTILEKQVR